MSFFSEISALFGKLIHFHPAEGDTLTKHEAVQAGHPLAAHVASVNPDGTVNLTVLDPNGETHARLNVPVVESSPPNGGVAVLPVSTVAPIAPAPAPETPAEPPADSPAPEKTPETPAEST